MTNSSFLNRKSYPTLYEQPDIDLLFEQPWNIRLKNAPFSTSTKNPYYFFFNIIPKNNIIHIQYKFICTIIWRILNQITIIENYWLMI